MAEEPTSPAVEPTEGGSTEPEGNGNPRSYTQDELDRIVAQRVQKSKAQFKDFDQYKQAAQRLAEIEAANQTESDKLRAAAEKARQDAEAATAREQQAVERARDTLVRAAVVSEASRQHAVDPDAVYALMDRSRLEIGESDEVVGVADAVKALLEERSYLLGSRPAPGFDGGARQTATAGSTRTDLNDRLRNEWLSKQGHA